MDELPIILISNDLKYAMTSLKIKTFERAREYYYTQREAVESGQVQVEQLVGVSDKLEKIKKYMQKYNSVREDVWRKLQFCHLEEGEEGQTSNPETIFPFPHREVYVPRYDDSSEQEGEIRAEELAEPQLFKIKQKRQANIDPNDEDTGRLAFDFDLSNKVQTFKEEWDRTQIKKAKRESSNPYSEQKSGKTHLSNLFEKSISNSSIVEIYGEKGVGKTALLLYFCQEYAKTSSKKIYFVNCGGGVTQRRFEKLQKDCPQLEYRDSYVLEHVLAVCRSAALDPNTGCIALDSLTNLLMEEEKTLIFLIKIFKIFSYLLNKGCKVVLTNYLQQAFDHDQNDPLTNHYSYYCAVTSEFLTYKYFLSEVENSDRVAVKMCRGGFVEAEFGVGESGVEKLEVKQGEREI